MAPITLGTSTVRELDGGLFSLNDLHTASGGAARHKPAFFLRSDQTKALVAEIQTSETRLDQVADSQLALKVVHGGPQRGTYACRELVIAYAAWISAAFHLKVIRVFLAATAPTTQRAIDTERFNRAQALASAVAAQVQSRVLEAALTGSFNPALDRLLIGMHYRPGAKQWDTATVSILPRDAAVGSMADIANMVATPDMLISNEEIVDLMRACVDRLGARIRHQPRCQA
jgi:hypothetical protein